MFLEINTTVSENVTFPRLSFVYENQPLVSGN